MYELRATRVLDVDMDRSEPLLMEFCRRCGNFGGYLEGRGLFLEDVTTPLKEGFYRTDLIFGCGTGKRPTIVVGEKTMLKLQAAKFTGMWFRPVPWVDREFEARKAKLKIVHRRMKERQRV
jgi:hypothetical protein